ncbi:MAG: heavy metal sensor histidine kinase [Steroidobacteraceae bacterium]
MSSGKAAVTGRRGSLVARLTLLSAASAFGLLLAAALFLNWELSGNLQRDAEDRLRHKVQVLERLLAESPPNLQGIRQEAHEEAEVSSESEFPFFLRVMDSQSHEVVASRSMAQLLPVATFGGDRTGAHRRWQSPQGTLYLLATADVRAGSSGATWTIHAAFDVTAMQRLLSRFQRDVILMLLVGLLAAATVGAWAVRRGLRPLHDIAAVMEPIGAAELDRRIATGRWPVELHGVADAFDRVLVRLQDSFGRLRQFSADLAHELRTPINNLMGEAQVALSRPRSIAEYERVLQSSLEELTRLARMIDGMLFLAQADQARMALKATPMLASRELHAVAEFYQALADEQGVTISVGGDAEFIADPMLVRRALSNLLSNALRHTSRGGLIQLQAQRASERVELSVSDNGAGIAQEHHAKLGDRFFRVDESRNASQPGYGLGLAIVRSIMELHAGALRIDSQPGRGTIAILSFPVTEAVQAV